MEEARRRARRRRFGYAAGAVALVLAVAGGVLLAGGGDADRTRDEATSNSTSGADGREMLFVRAIVDSREGLFAIDTASGEVKRVRVRLSCGDTPFCLISTGGELIISSGGRTTAYNPAAPGRTGLARLGKGWIAIPSANSGHVWLGILARGKLGGPYRRGLSAVREIDLEGNVVQSMRPPQGKWPAGAVESGLLFEYGRSLRLWSLEARGFTIRIPGAFPAATSGNLVASRGDRGSEFLLTDTRTGEVTPIAPPAGHRWLGYQGAFTPDGSRLALPITEGLAVVDVDTLDTRVISGSTEVDPIYAPMAWSSKGDRLFFVGEDGTVMSYRVGSDSLTAHAKFDASDQILQMVAG